MTRSMITDSDGQRLIKSQNDFATVYLNSLEQFHRLGGPAVEWENGGREWWAFGYQVSNKRQAEQACDPNTNPETITQLATQPVDPGVAALAAHNPNCPEWARVQWALTQGNQL